MLIGIVTTLHNPFEFGRELGAGELVDREEELAELERVLLEGGKHFLIGPRRYGKTSLLAAAAERAASRGALVLRYNVEAFPALDLLVTRLITDAAARLIGPVKKVAGAIGEFFANLRPSVSVSPADGTWTVGLGPVEGGRALPLVAEALHGLERLAAAGKRPVALVLDEFQLLVERDGVAAEAQVRAAIQQHRHVGYLFAGSNARLLAAMTGEADRPFYRLGTRRFLGPVPRAPFGEFLGRGLAAVATVTDEGVSTILDAAEDVPYNVQLLAHACWERARDEAGALLDTAFVRETHRRAAARMDPLYSHLWISLTVPQQKALLAVIETGGTGLTSAAVTGRYGVPVPTMQTAVDALEDKGILRTEAAEGKSHLRVEDPLFAAWVRGTVASP